ncbi:hypothetical protein SK355_02365 [Candidatus Fukatsuia symbiotica]|uniref:Uncharacterized protein n=1 Tax=Candidatus Fukatsuia symbiotica TaxID=1878942 RepID=A0A2U8I2H1_9GAMM|nr:hypothetical protein [Candidatus Fukatsuia symbiotica]AWK13306.1 hypothetical protein CCS41_00440 [Candidatus Fukatsuia symbiotica]MEA9444182.1 hypothetical protein [Candidatus Fukatsuia symbiotica]
MKHINIFLKILPILLLPTLVWASGKYPSSPEDCNRWWEPQTPFMPSPPKICTEKKPAVQQTTPSEPKKDEINN